MIEEKVEVFSYNSKESFGMMIISEDEQDEELVHLKFKNKDIVLNEDELRRALRSISR